MDSGLMRKIEKAKDYALQPERIRFAQCKATFKGDNDDHEISYESGSWQCNCNYFAGHDTCSHTMAMQIILEDMVTNEKAVTA
ncbi:MAG: hypothetical protein O2821_09490 [Chloroflexi bacterium]|nr:hypothetical protein [Chloroflexota bacterium]MDA1226573.1 hypothetical protein [Chloroflexota bacterium]